MNFSPKKVIIRTEILHTDILATLNVFGQVKIPTENKFISETLVNNALHVAKYSLESQKDDPRCQKAYKCCKLKCNDHLEIHISHHKCRDRSQATGETYRYCYELEQRYARTGGQDEYPM